MTAAARKAFDEAVALENSGDMNKALASYLKAQELSPQDTEIAYRTASALLQSGYLEEAQSQLRRIVFSEPDHLGARTSLGNCHFLMGDFLNASLNFKEVLEREPENRNALFGQASVLLKDQNPGEAEELTKRLLALMPSSAAALTLLADCHIKTKQNTTAIATYRKALKFDKDYVPALVGLSEALLLAKRYDEVVRYTVEASQLMPGDARALELLSDALAGKGDLDDAQEAAEAAMKLSGPTMAAHVRLSVLCRKRGAHVDALKHALAAHDLDRDAHEPINALGAGLASLNHAKKARIVLTAKTTGKELDRDIREFIGALIDNETPDDVLQTTASQNAHEQVDRDPNGDNSGVSNPEETDASAEQQLETARTDLKSRSLNVSEDEYQLPNVLGLSRRDES